MEQSDSPNQDARAGPEGPVRSPSNLLAFRDIGFITRNALRPVRLQLELLKPELIQNEEGIRSTIAVFGSSRIPSPEEANRFKQVVAEETRKDPDNPDVIRRAKTAESLVEKAKYYKEAKRFAELVSISCQVDGECDFVIVTGGGPGIMEAANRGAFEAGAKSIGLNITLPMEQEANPYITPELCFKFHYFAVRKMHFLLRAKALVVFPGGFGTLDELFETLTLIQTSKMEQMPIVLFGREFWDTLINWQYLVDQGVISQKDLDLFSYVDTAEEAWKVISDHFRANGELNHSEP